MWIIFIYIVLYHIIFFTLHFKYIFTYIDIYMLLYSLMIYGNIILYKTHFRDSMELLTIQNRGYTFLWHAIIFSIILKLT